MLSKIIAIIFFLVLSLDFKSEESGGTTWQYTIVIISFICICLSFAEILKKVNMFPKRVPRMVFGGMAYLFVLLGLAFVHGIPLNNYIRMLYPIVVFWGGFVIASNLLEKNSLPEKRWLVRLLLITGAINIVWLIFTALVLKGIDMEVMRYQMASFGTRIWLAYVLTILVLNQRYKWLATIILILILFQQAVMVTRTDLVSLLAALLASVFLYWRMSSKGIVRRWGSDKIFLYGCMALVGLVTTLTILELKYDTLTRWTKRAWVLGENKATLDIPLALRISQDRGMLKALQDKPQEILLGKGFGSFFEYDIQYLFSTVDPAFLAGSNPDAWFVGTGWQKPDTTWVPLLHDGGVVFLFLFLLVTYVGIRMAYRLISDPRVNSGYRKIFVWCLLLLVMWFSRSLTSNMLFSRNTCAVMGAVLGLIYTFKFQDNKNRLLNSVHSLNKK